MRDLRTLLRFVRPYTALAALSLISIGVLVAFDLAIPRLIEHIIDRGIAQNDEGVVTRTALVMLGISALSALISIANNYTSVRVGEGVARDLREALFLKIQSYSFANLDAQKTGDLMTRLSSDVAALKMLTQVALRIGSRAPLLMLGSMVLMISTGPRLALVMLPLIVVTSVLIGFFVVKMEPMFRRVQGALNRLNGVLDENIAGVRVVKALVRGAHEQERFGLANEAMTERSIKALQLSSSMTPALTLCVNIGVVIVVWSGGMDAIAGRLSIGQVVAFSNYLLTTMTPLIMMTMLANIWAAGSASARRVNEVFATQPDVADAPDAIALTADAPASLAMEDVGFTYAGHARAPALADIDLRAEPGQTIAILGATGAGKSTLINLIPRFYDATTGTVSVAEHDVRTLASSSLLEHVSVVPQESILVSGTVKDNIRYGRPDASDAEVIAAAEAAQAHAFITALPQGYDSPVAQRGVNFSGGQKQRLAIARALLMKPPMLILDDSTSAVDVETETRIQDALARESAQRTTFVVAQRISTVLRADRIIVLDKGRIVASGTHRELLRTSAVYREIYDSQLGGSEAPS